jgi:hypothetical protein
MPVRDAAKALDLEFLELTHPDLEGDDLIQPYEGPLPLELFKACVAVLRELTDDTHRYDSADDITDGAAGYEDPHDWLAATRLLLRFLDRADQEAAGKASASDDSARRGPWRSLPRSLRGEGSRPCPAYRMTSGPPTPRCGPRPSRVPAPRHNPPFLRPRRSPHAWAIDLDASPYGGHAASRFRQLAPFTEAL